MPISWIYLLIAGALEILFTVALKYSEGFTRLIPTILLVLVGMASFFFVSLAMRTISIGTAYTVWAGIGTAGTVLCGILFFGDSYHIVRLVSIAFIIIGIFGLKFSHID